MNLDQMKDFQLLDEVLYQSEQMPTSDCLQELSVTPFQLGT